MDIQAVLGNKIRELRQAKGISHEKLAELSNLHRTYISSIELGHRNVSLQNIKAIADALGVSIQDLFASA